MIDENRSQGTTALAVYLQELRESAFLSPDEERRLGAAVRTGRQARERRDCGDPDDCLRQVVEDGRKAEERLAKAHLPLVLRMAKAMVDKNRGVGVSLEDVVLAGNEGLVEAILRYNPEAIGRYDPRSRPRLATYAWSWIRNKMAREVRLYRWRMRIPEPA
jgi:DNA-directed RNA polymerase sigma subunit (sigma70/sigma32)